MKTKIILALFLVALFSCNQNKTSEQNNEKKQLIIFHAGSLSVPIKEMIDSFKVLNPGVEILTESAGSVDCARKITEIKKPCDIMASADYAVIDKLLIPEYANWNIKFAGNEMAIVYTEKSKYANEIDSTNWFNILLKKDVLIGRADPNADPCGYRSVLCLKLADLYYAQNGLSDKILAKNQENIRPKEVDLIGLLESHSLDYIFLYRSVAVQHNLKYVVLPDAVNLKNNALASFYAKANVEIKGKTPEEKITKKGEPMIYGVTILKNAPNKELAIKFLDYMLSKNGGSLIMEKNGQPSVIPSTASGYDSIPEILKKYSIKN